MPWYVIQTYTGKEEKLVEMIRRMIPGVLYQDCFVTYHEQLMKRQQENRVYIEREFPGYVFIITSAPEQLFPCLKKIPAMSKMISDGDYFFLPLDPKESAFLEHILDEHHIVRLSYVSTDGQDHILYTSGPIEAGLSRIVSCNFRKRYAIVRVTLSGEEKNVRLGIILNDDIRRELAYGKVEAPIQLPERYRVPNKFRMASVKKTGNTLNEISAEHPKTETSGIGIRSQPEFQTGDQVIVVSGPFAGMSAMVYQMRKQTVKIGVHLFEQDVTVEVPADILRKTVA